MAGYDIGPKISLKGESAFNQSISKIQNNLRVLGSEMEKTTTEFAENSRSVEALTAKNKILNKQIEEQKKIFSTIANELEKQKDKLKEYGQALQKAQESGDPREIAKAEKAYQDQERAVSRLTVAFNEASTSITRLEQDFESNNQAIQESSQSLNEFGDTAQEVANQADNIGEKFSGIGDIIATGMAAAAKAIAAVGAAAIAAMAGIAKIGDEFQKASNILQVQTGSTAERMTELNDIMKEVYANNFGENMEDVARSLAEVRKQFGRAITDEGLKDLTEQALGLKKAFDYDVTESVRAANSMMNQFGIDAEQAFNLIAQGAQNGLDYSGELIDSINEYSPQFDKVGMYAEDMFNIFQSGAQNGAWNLDKIGDAVKEFSIRAIDGSDTTIDGFTRLGLSADEMAKKFADGGDTAREAFYQVISSLREMDDPIAQSIAGVDLFGTMWEDLGPDVVTQLDSIRDGFDQNKNMMEEINQIQYNTVSDALSGLGRALETDFILPISEKATPLFRDFISELANGTRAADGDIKKLGEAFSNAFVGLSENISKISENASNFINEFVNGWKKNAPKLEKALGQLVKSLAKAFTKILPEEMQKPIQKMIEDISKSFSSGGLKKAIETTKNIFQKLAKTISGIAKTTVPIFIKAIDLLGNNLDKIIPLLTAVVVTTKTWSGIQTAANFLKSFTIAINTASTAVTTFIAANGAEAVATAASTGALTLKQVAVGALNKQIGLATAAQYLWNASMTANPIGIIITLLGAAGAAILAYNLTQKEAITTSEIFAESQRNIVNTYQDGIEKASEWKNGIAGARDILADINDEVIVSAEKQQELSQAMRDVQREITEVAKAGQEERGSLNDLEIQRLDELFQKMHELAEQEVEVKKAYQKAVKTQAEIAAANKSTSLEEYEKISQDIILTAERTNKHLSNKAHELATEELMLIDKKYGEQATMSNEAYANEVRAVEKRKKLIIDAANAEHEETLAILQKGYADIMIEQSEYSTAYQDTLDQMRAKKKAHDAEMEQFAKEYYDNINKGHMNLITAQDDYQRKSEDSKIAHNLEMLELYNQYTENLSENATKENAILLDMVAQSGQSYDELNESTKSMVEAVLVSFKLLDEESRKTLNQALEGMGMEIDSHGDLLYTSGENAGKKVIDGFDSADIPTEFNEIANTGINSYLEPFDTSQELARTEVGKLKRASLSTLEQAKDDYYRQGLAAVSAYIKGLTSQKPPALGSLVELPKRSSSRIGEEVVQENLNIRSIAPIGIVDETNNFATNFAREMQSVRRQIQNVIPTNIHSTADISLSKKKAKATSGFADQQNAFYFTIESFNNYSNEDAKQLAQTIMYEANNIYKRDRKVWA